MINYAFFFIISNHGYKGEDVIFLVLDIVSRMPSTGILESELDSASCQLLPLATVPHPSAATQPDSNHNTAVQTCQ